MKIMPPVGYDMNSALPLLQEYTAKVRDVCQRRLQRRASMSVDNKWLLVTLFVLGLTADSLSNAVFLGHMREGPKLVVLGGFLFIVSGSILMRNRRLHVAAATEASRLAGILKRLTTIVSQYNAHAPARFRDPLEVALRLTEADAALAMYRTTFGRPPASDVEFPDPIAPEVGAPAPLASSLQPRP